MGWRLGPSMGGAFELFLTVDRRAVSSRVLRAGLGR